MHRLNGFPGNPFVGSGEGTKSVWLKRKEYCLGVDKLEVEQKSISQ